MPITFTRYDKGPEVEYRSKRDSDMSRIAEVVVWCYDHLKGAEDESWRYELKVREDWRFNDHCITEAVRHSHSFSLFFTDREDESRFCNEFDKEHPSVF